MEKKFKKIIEELWDDNRISKTEYDRIIKLLDTDSVNLTVRWNFLGSKKKSDMTCKMI